MILFRKFVSCIGVAFCAAPIMIVSISTVSAQQGSIQGTSQSQMLFEMQAMRQEIAELRDMVERQAYQLRRMQNANVSNQDSRPTIQPIEQQTTYQATTQATTQSVTAAGNSNYSVGQVPTEINVPTTSQVPTGSQVPIASQVPTAIDAPVYNESVYIEERSIDASVVPQQAGQRRVSDIPNNYPPVEERTIAASQADQQVLTYNPETYNQDFNNSNTGIEVEGDYNTQAPATVDSNFPTPYQRQSPARQPVAADSGLQSATELNSATAAGGIVAIPQPVATETIVEPAITNASAVSIDEQTYYQQGFELLKQEKHDEAVATFKKQISDYPSGSYSDDAHYWIAESLYVNRELDQSKLYFKTIIDKFDQSSRLPDAMLKTAYIEQEQGNAIEARILLQEIVQFHPRSNAAISAKNRLADLN